MPVSAYPPNYAQPDVSATPSAAFSAFLSPRGGIEEVDPIKECANCGTRKPASKLSSFKDPYDPQRRIYVVDKVCQKQFWAKHKDDQLIKKSKYTE